MVDARNWWICTTNTTNENFRKNHIVGNKVAAGIRVFVRDYTHTVKQKKKMKKVVIVGGGVAGLSCGKRLMDSGKFKVTLLEANSKVGGRVETLKFGEYFIENGAQWVHGEEGNQVFEIANSMKILDVDKTSELNFTRDVVFVTSTGKKLEKEIQDRVSLVVEKILEGPEKDETKGSLGDWATKKFKEVVATCPLDPTDPALDVTLLDWIHRFQDNLDGADNWFQTSLISQNEYVTCEGNPTVSWKPPSCYSSFLGVILNSSPNFAPSFQPELPNWIELEKEVVKIEIISADKEPVRVTCSDKTQYTCDHLIVTVSLGVLKQCYKDLFHPALPEKKVLAIEHLGMGTMNKLHFDFQKQWWPNDIIGFSLLWDDVGDYWSSDIADETLAKNIDGFPLWCRNILGFYRVSSHPTALSSFITGPAARFMEKLTDEEVKRVFMQVCRHFLKDYDIPDPKEFCQSSWFSNRFSRGSYSFHQTSSEKANVRAVDLAEPILNKSGSPVICFAGEATHGQFYSTVHGAFESGQREADRLISGLSVSK